MIQRSRQQARIFFIILSGLVIIRCIALAGRFVPVHDTFSYLISQYLAFFNEPALKGSIALWFPFTTQGVIGNLQILSSGGILASALSALAPLFKGINFMYIFHAGILCEEIALLAGILLLSRSCFRSSAAAFFVASAVLFTSISSVQIYLELHAFYLLPLIFYFLLRTLKTRSAWTLFLTVTLIVATLPGNPLYLFPFTVCLIGVFIGSFFLFSPRETAGDFAKFFSSLTWRHALAVIIPACFFGVILYFAWDGINGVVNCTVGRGVNWNVKSLSDFLSYGGSTNVSKYMEMVFRNTNNLDNSVYGGVLILPFVLTAMFASRERISYVFATLALFVVMFGAGTVIAVLFFRFFPLGSIFRHIGLTAPIAKLFLIFYAGFGFDAFWGVIRDSSGRPRQEVTARERLIALIPAFCVFLFFVLVLLQHCGVYATYSYLHWTSFTNNQVFTHPERVAAAERFLLMLYGAYLAVFVIIARRGRAGLLACTLLLSLHLGDVYSYKIEREFGRIPSVSRSCFALFKACGYQFINGRSQQYLLNYRFTKLQPFILNLSAYRDLEDPVEMVDPVIIGTYGALYWTLDSFLFCSTVSPIFRTDYWSAGIDTFYRIWVPVKSRRFMQIGFPIPSAESFKKACAAGYPKLQVFSKFRILPDEEAVRDVLGRRDFSGDLLLVAANQCAPAEHNSGRGITESPLTISVRDSDRLPGATIRVDDFTFTTLRVSVTNTSGYPAVLYYADAWHPRWHAFVNGRTATVMKADLAYKAVVIPAGESSVFFTFGDPVIRTAAALLVLFSILALGIIVYSVRCSLRET